MIDIEKAKNSFNKFLEGYNGQDRLGFQLKVVHTYHVVDIAENIAAKLNLSDEDIGLAKLIALLHDIGRFEEIKYTSRFDSAVFDHASCGVKMLFEDGLIRSFIGDNNFDEIIKTAIANHSRKEIRYGLDKRCLLHAKIIRDADKLDNFRVKRDEKAEAIFLGRVKSAKDLENSTISNKVFEAVKSRKSVDIHDRITPLDYWICVLAFVFDLNFKESYEIMKANRYVDCLIDKFNYQDTETKKRMEEIRNIINDFVTTQSENNVMNNCNNE